MVEEEYPINPTLDSLIQAFKEFKYVTFPRGMPKPASIWKELIQPLTKYEAHIIQVANDYLCGQVIKTDDLAPPENLKLTMDNFNIRSVEDNDYWIELVKYKKQIEKIAYLIEDCVQELGNPCQKFRIE